MTDIHTHILPGIDDGSDSLDMSLEMLELSAESGVKTVVATPHCNIPGEYDNYASRALKELFEELKKEKENAGIPVDLILSMEVYTTPELPELIRQKRLLTLGNSGYLLMEFAFNEDPDFCFDMLKEVRKQGLKPVIAHPERYFFVQDDPVIAYEWCTEGYALQVNKGSLLGSFGPGPERTARLILGHGLAACVASDAHSSYERTTHLSEARRLIHLDYGEEMEELLLSVNPERILAGKELYGFRPIPF